MRVLSTRTTPEGYKRRRYESAGGRRWFTIEVPETVWNGINGQGRSRNRADEWNRARERDSMKLQAKVLFGAGRTIAEICAAMPTVSRRSIQRWCTGK